jgi:hypothetical protein
MRPLTYIYHLWPRVFLITENAKICAEAEERVVAVTTVISLEEEPRRKKQLSIEHDQMSISSIDCESAYIKNTYSVC